MYFLFPVNETEKRNELFRANSTDSSSGCWDSQFSCIRSCTTISSQQTDILSSSGEEAELTGIRNCSTVSNDSFVGVNIRNALTESSQSLDGGIEVLRLPRFREADTTSGSDGGYQDEPARNILQSKYNQQKGVKDITKNTDNKTDSYLGGNKQIMSSQGSNGMKDVTNLPSDEIFMKDKKRLLVDPEWEGLGSNEPKLVKYASIGGPLEHKDISKMFMRRTSSEGIYLAND